MRVLILLALLGSALAAPKTVSRIVGGEPTTVDQYPYMANMQYNWWSWWIQWCGGSLITEIDVLTAAHCYEGDSHTVWRVLLGTSYASSGGSIHYASRIILHENYDNPVLDNDVAIVKLATPAILSNVVGTVYVAGSSYVSSLPDGTPLSTVGWGSLSSGGNYPEQLQHVELHLINHALCAERYEYLKTNPLYANWPDISIGMICAGILDIGGKDACQGDSGGPLSHVRPNGDVVVGIVSWGFQCADPFYPGVNANVSHYTDWIVANSL